MAKLPSPKAILGIFPTLMLAVACTSGGPGGASEDVIARQTFVDVYVQLRIAALKDPTEDLPLEERDRILQEAGVSEEDLIRFIEVRGGEVQFMRQLWEEVDSLIREVSNPVESVT
jgi:hypothetical protein